MPSTVLSRLSHFTLEYIFLSLHLLPAKDQSYQNAHQIFLLTSIILIHTHFAPLESIGAVFPLLICLLSSHSNISPLLLGYTLCYSSELWSLFSVFLGVHSPVDTLSHRAQGQARFLHSLKHFLSTFYLQSTAQKMPELEGHSGTYLLHPA